MGVKVHKKSFKFYDSNRNSKEWLKQKEKQSIYLWVELNVHHLKNRSFFNLRKTTLPICYNKTRITIINTKGDPGKFSSVIKTVTQQVQLCPRSSVTVYDRHKYLFTALEKHDSSVLFLIGYIQPKESKQYVLFLRS